MLCKRKPSVIRKKLRRLISVLLVVVTLSAIYIELAVKAQLRDVIIREMRTVSETAVNMAVDGFLAENADVGERLTILRYNDNGAVTALSTDSAYINYVKSQITSSAQGYIDALSHDRGVSAHLGSFSGLVLLNNVGPVVSFAVGSSQTIACSFESTFEQAGINQTVHHITLTVAADVLVYNPFRIQKTIHTVTSYEIAQTVIVGTVPTYGGVLTY